MFARYRRNSTAAPAGTTTASKFQTNNNGNNGNSKSGADFLAKDTAEAVANLEELRIALDRLELLTDKIGPKKKEKESDENTAARDSVNVQSVSSTDKTEDDDKKTEENDAATAATATGDNDNDEAAKEEIMTSITTPTKTNAPKSKYERSPSAAASDLRALANATFLEVEPKDELEIIELIRRIAELVVLSERRGGQLLGEVQLAREESVREAEDAKQKEKERKREAAEETAAEGDEESGEQGSSSSSNKGENGSQQSKGGESTEEQTTSNDDNGKKHATEEEKIQRPQLEYNEDIALPYLALFELFCERNALANIVNIVTGVAFLRHDDDDGDDEQGGESSSSSSNNNDNDKSKDNFNILQTPPQSQQEQQHLLLPPLTIATQAVQSVSILIQNVSCATSLYFLLSNNRVNDLIKLPLHLYKRAELNALHEAHEARYSNNNNGKRGSPRKRGSKRHTIIPPPNLMNYVSSEMGELTTHFVSFLKSLAMRVNSETLQFFLSFPLNESGDDGSNEAMKRNSSTQSTNQLNTYLERRKVVEFPLYSRALEFCSSELNLDSFVRVTAMNVCMNIIRLVTVFGDGDDSDCEDSEDDGSVRGKSDCGSDNSRSEVDQKKAEQQYKLQQKSSSLPTSTPSGILHTAPPSLPLQDRIAIAQYACHPRHVSDLVSPLCARLTSQFGLVEGTVRAMEELNDIEAAVTKMDAATALATPTKRPSDSRKRDGKKREDTEKERAKLRNTIQNLIANVQDELLLLDDLLKVGLLSLNEQAIEMMLATFVYPMLLQPLLLPLTRFSSSKRADGGGKDGGAGRKDGEKGDKGGKKKPLIALQTPVPFSSEAIVNDDDDEEELATLSNGETASAECNTSNGGNPFTTTKQPAQQQEYSSSSDMDLAPSKTALFGLSIIFHTITNPTCRHLLLVALLHPQSPVASGGMVISAPPQITLPCKRKEGVHSSDDFQLEIRMENNQAKLSREREGFQSNVNVYTFGTEPISSLDGDGEKDDGGQGGYTVNDGNDQDFMRNCVFILAPALVDMLRNHTSGDDNQQLSSQSQENSTAAEANSTTATTSATRLNPYRNILLNSISGIGEMVSLQRLASAALHAAVSSVDNCSIVQTILFTSLTSSASLSPPPATLSMATDTDQPDDDDDCDVKATVKNLCQGILNTFVTYDGWFKVKFNMVAARTLMDVISNNPNYIALVANLMEGIRLETAEYLMTLPYYLDAKSRGGGGAAADNNNKELSPSRKKLPNNSINNRNSDISGSSNDPVDSNRQHLDHWLLDRFFFDQADKTTNSIVENVCYLKEHAVRGGGGGGEDGGDNAKEKEQYRYGLEVLGSISITGTSTLLCEDDTSRIIDNMVVDGARKGNTPFHCAASWALTCLYLDAFCVKLSKMMSNNSNNIEGGAIITSSSVPQRELSTSSVPQRELSTSSIPQQRKLSYISASKLDDDDESSSSDDAGFSLAHISSKFAIAMLDEGESSDKKTAVPTHGSAVGLVGKAAFPCVCEVSSVFSNLFTGRTCISNEGIQWQSLYLVVVGKWAVLAEPGHGGTGGEGRVITACRLACLAVKKDNSSLANNKTPARRLLVAHASLDPRPPSLFLVDKTTASKRGGGGGSAGGSSGPNLGRNGLRLTRSRMDLWFEDANAAGHACKVLSAKIAKARAKRGGRIRSALLAR